MRTYCGINENNGNCNLLDRLHQSLINFSLSSFFTSVFTSVLIIDKKLISSFTNRVEVAKSNRANLMEKLKAASDATISAEEKAAIMDNMLENEEEDMKLMEQELKRLRDVQYKKSQVCHNLSTLKPSQVHSLLSIRDAHVS